MGYRSDVRILVSTKGFEVLEKGVLEYLEKKQKGDDYNLLNSCDVKKIDKESKEVYLGWNWVKWYTDDFDDVDAVMHGLKKVEEADLSYQFARIGEDENDVERDEHYNKDDRLSGYIWISIAFED